MTMAYALPAPRTSEQPCPRCVDGWRLTEPWQQWWDLYATAEASYRADHPDGDWPTSPEFWRLHEQMPSSPEAVPCASCNASGQLDDDQRQFERTERSGRRHKR